MAKGIITGNEPVYVQSKELNGQSVTIPFQKVFVKQGGREQERTLSRTYTFIEYVARMPFKMAKILVKGAPDKFMILGPVDESEEKIKKEIEALNDKVARMSVEHKCELCGKVFPIKAGLVRHMQVKHREEWLKEKVAKDFEGRK